MKKTALKACITLAVSLGGLSTARAACSDAAAPSVGWSECDKAGANLSGVNLSDASLDQANLTGADLSFANLENAGMPYAILTGANLTGTILSGAFLYIVELSFAHLTNTTMNNANLYGATLAGATLTGTDMRGATLVKTNLSNANLIGADMSFANMLDAYLPFADRSGATVPFKDLADFQSAPGINLTGADLRTVTYQFAPNPIPEPEHYLLMLAGLSAIVTMVRRSRVAAVKWRRWRRWALSPDAVDLRHRSGPDQRLIAQTEASKTSRGVSASRSGDGPVYPQGGPGQQSPRSLQMYRKLHGSCTTTPMR